MRSGIGWRPGDGGPEGGPASAGYLTVATAPARLSCQPSQLVGAPGTVCTRYRLTAPIGEPRLHRTGGRHVQSRGSPGVPRYIQAASKSLDVTRRADTVCPRRIRVGAFEMRPESRTPLGPELQRSVARDKVDRPTLRRPGVRWRRGGSSQPRGEDAPRHAPRKLSSGNYERVTNRAAVNTSDS